MNLTSKKSTRSALALVLIISIGVHLLGLFTFGVVKIAQAVMREEVTFQPPPPPPPAQEIPEYTVNLEQRNAASSPLRPSPITVDSPDIELPALDIDVTVDSYSTYGRGSAGFGSGNGGSTSSIQHMREMAITADLFGAQISATKLGVILDISRSTHKQIDKVLNEINKKFTDAIVVLVPGCAISSYSTSIYAFREYERGTRKHTKVGRYSTQPYIEGLLETNPAFVEIWGELEQQDNGYILFAESSTGTTASGGSNNAMEFLRDKGVDTIYWFADFEDSIHESEAKNVLRSMKRGGISLFMHDFVTPLSASKKTRREQTLPLLQELADETDGQFFLKVLN